MSGGARTKNVLGSKMTWGPRRACWALIPFVLLWACSPAAVDEPSGPEETTTTVTSPTPTPGVTSTTTTPPSDDPLALILPFDLQRDGRCNVNVFREDETGTTWLMVCAGFDPVGLPLAVRGIEHSAHFRYLVDEDQKRVGVRFDALKVVVGGCNYFNYSTPDFLPFEAPLVDEIVTYETSLEVEEACAGTELAGTQLTYQVTWDMETDAITIDGLLEPID